ncbi:uncharacterized protein LOC116574359 [Mustela erminea]|uniref:uncharacterized protein LOC116574359 n=1 Tax=Mustela erminea TaxID=36723 RepID=UPI001386B907|nr:uncharacterized protein LOC116574359 [Mustela erminea]XP_032170981.1 uncharacterized protein LOC116574359 [Mustela erminea]XP_032170982.1 uncharacterized protein LOC116574359 [Mustela erminea]XP_032170983.1 uncharacterized protein LOC116574359 [Mustela erminea]XP_032170984.1 uncharacterized protein LOC116574359 [Mustela erminea]
MVAKEQCRVLTLVCDLGGSWAWSMGQCTLQDHKQEVLCVPSERTLAKGHVPYKASRKSKRSKSTDGRSASLASTVGNEALGCALRCWPRWACRVVFRSPWPPAAGRGTGCAAAATTRCTSAEARPTMAWGQRPPQPHSACPAPPRRRPPGASGVPSPPPLPSPRGRCRLVGGCGFGPPSRGPPRGGPAPEGAASCQNLRQNRLWPLWSEMGGIFTISCLVGLNFACCVTLEPSKQPGGSLFVNTASLEIIRQIDVRICESSNSESADCVSIKESDTLQVLPSVVKAKMTTTESFAIIYRKVVAENDKLQPPETKGSLSSWKPGTA